MLNFPLTPGEVPADNCRMTGKISILIWVLAFAIALLGIFVGTSLFIAPERFLANVDFTARGANFLAQMWGARQLAIALTILFTLWKRNPALLQVSLSVYALMNLLDSGIGIVQHDISLAAGSSVFLLLSSSLIYLLSRQKKADS